MAITRRTTLPNPQQQQQQQQQQSNTLNLPQQHLETNSNNQQQQQKQPKEASKYEQTREQRIKENNERLKKLGILDLSLQFNSISSRRTPKSQSERKTPLKSPPLGPTEPRRRSSRLQDAPPVTYVEPKEDKPRRKRDIVLEEGSKPEFYTEEHEKLLGNTEMPWTFFVDGYAKDGSRIYDPVQGKTCHQCRQKTLGQRTRCCKCSLVQGQFCGDCLYMRYGEHVVEANQNPDWICPPCRGICNCSLCRHAKGWAPTGALYKTINKLGYKSVAHFLVETRRAPPTVDTASDTQQTAKRSLPFEGMEVPTDDKTEIGLQSEGNATSDIGPNQSESKSSMNGPVQDKNGPKTVGRPRKRSKKENLDAGEQESLKDNGPISGMKIPNISGSVTVQDKNGSKAVGRPRTRSKKENLDAGEQEPLKDNGPISEMKSPSISGSVTVQEKNGSKAVGRPRTRSKKENLDAGEQEPLKDNGPISETKSPIISGSVTDSIARRLRSRNRT